MKKFRELSEAIKDKYDIGEYDQEGDMAKSDLRSIIANSKRVHDMLKDDDNLPEWVQSKITKAEDYMSTVANYLESEMNEETGFEKTFRKNTGETYDQYANRRAKEEDERQEQMKKQKEDYIKQGIIKAESYELSEGRPSQRHPLEGHEYHRKSDAELVGIAKDAHKAAEAMKSHNTTAENKYRDQANDSATVRYFRKKSGMPDWYKKKYGHMKEEVELDEALRHEIAGQVGRFIGNKIDPVHGDIMHAHGKEAYRQAAYHIRKTVNDVKDAVSSLHDRLHKQLRTGGLATEEVEIDEARYPGFRPGLGLGKRGAPSQRDNYNDFNDGRPFGFTPIKDKDESKSGMSDKLRQAKIKNPAMKSMAKEEVELQELSKELLARYKEKAEKSKNKELGYLRQSKEREKILAHANKYRNRRIGLSRVEDRLKKEEVEELDEGMKPYVSSVSPKVGEKGSHDVLDKEGKIVKSFPHTKEGMKAAQSHLMKMKEEVEQLDEKNVPTSPEKWAQAKSQAKAKFDVYPSAYANGWAAKKYKEMGGGWKSVSEETELDEGYFKNQEIERQETERLAKKDDLPFTPDKPKKKSVVVGKKPEGYSIARQLARQGMKKYMKPVKEENMSKKAKIVKDIMKKPSGDEKFNAEPEISKTIVRNN
jgi:hypothetical protein